MSYAEALIKTRFNYGALRSMSPALVELNPLGTCFNLCCMWVKELHRDPTQSSSVLNEKMRNSIMTLALRHKNFISAVDAKGIDQERRKQAWRNAIDKFDLKSDSLAPGGVMDGTSRVPDSDSRSDRVAYVESFLAPSPFTGLAVGDMWGVLWEYFKLQPRPYGCVLNTYLGANRASQTGGHAISAFIPAGGPYRLRVFDMNAGEFLIESQDHWRTWSKGLDGTADPTDGLINFVDVMDLRPK